MIRNRRESLRRQSTPRIALKPMLEVLEDRLAPAAYSLTDLGTLGGSYSYAGYGNNLQSDTNEFSSEVINNSGQVVGVSQTADVSSSGEPQAFLYANGQMTDLGAFPLPPGFNGPGSSLASGINNSGQIVGASETATGNDAFLYSDGQMTDLNSLVTSGASLGTLVQADAINDKGQIVGELAPNGAGDQFAFLYSNGSVSELVDPTGGDFTDTYAHAINDAGQIVGMMVQENGINSDAFLYSNGTTTDLVPALNGVFTNVLNSSANGINSSGQVVGSVTGGVIGEGVGSTHAFLYSNGTVTDLGSGFQAFAINDSGQIVGAASKATSSNTATSDAFVYSNGTWTDLNSLIPANANVTLLEAVGIDDNGQIVAEGIPNNSIDIVHLYLLTPTQSTPISITNGTASSTIISNGSSQQVTVSATISDNGSPATAGNVVFSLIGPNGTVGSGSPNGVAVGPNGQATDTLTVPAGAYAGVPPVSSGAPYILQVSYTANGQTTTQDFFNALTIISSTGYTITNGTVTPDPLTYSGNGQQVTVSAAVYYNGSPTTSSVIFSLITPATSKSGGDPVATDGANGSNGVAVGSNGQATDTLTVPGGTAAGTYDLFVNYTVNGQTVSQIFSSALTINPATINPVPVTVTVSPVAAITASASAQDVVATAIVTPASGSVNEGDVTFTLLFNGAPVVGSAPVDVNVINGQAILANSNALVVPANIPAGAYTIQASYSDVSGNFMASAPATTPLTINPGSGGGGGGGNGGGSNGGGGGSSSGGGGGGSEGRGGASGAAPPSLSVPPLLAFFDSLLGGTETVNADGTETITADFFGIPLLVSTFGSSGKLESVLLFGINVTVLFELL